MHCNDFTPQLNTTNIIVFFSFLSVDEIWVGANDLENEGQWTWVSDNSNAMETIWTPGEPNDWEGAEDCALTQFTSHQLNDAPCGTPAKYVCEKQADW